MLLLLARLAISDGPSSAAPTHFGPAVRCLRCPLLAAVVRCPDFSSLRWSSGLATSYDSRFKAVRFHRGCGDRCRDEQTSRGLMRSPDDCEKGVGGLELYPVIRACAVVARRYVETVR